MSAKPRAKTAKTTKTLDPAEHAHFEALKGHWWADEGELAGLHAYNPVRLSFIQDAARQGLGQKSKLAGLHVLDVGCGGGILSEGLAGLGAEVTGIDVGGEAIASAKAHAKAGKLKIEYVHTEIENFTPKAKYDMVIASEVIEHVADPAAFVQECTRLLKPKGVLVISTFNRTIKSLALGIGMAEYVLGLAPKGTHHWNKFLKPSEIAHMLAADDLQIKGLMGARYNPLSRTMSLAPGDLSMNYLLWAQR